VPEDLFFSFPVQLRGARRYRVVEDLQLSAQLRAKLPRFIRVRYSPIISAVSSIVFSALTLLVGRQEEHLTV